MAATETLIKAIIATAQLMGSDWDEASARMFCEDLSGFPEPQVLAALRRCRMEVKTRLTVADVISRLDDGRPGPDEAWARIPRDERQTVVWTTETAQAWDVARHAEHPAAQRAAFTERYKALVADARQRGIEPQWDISLGWDATGREGPIQEAVAKGLLPAGAARNFLPPAEIPPQLHGPAYVLKIKPFP